MSDLVEIRTYDDSSGSGVPEPLQWIGGLGPAVALAKAGATGVGHGSWVQDILLDMGTMHMASTCRMLQCVGSKVHVCESSK